MGALRRRTLDREHLGISDTRDPGDTRPDGFAVEVNQAGPAQPLAATELGTGEAELVPQHPEKRRVRLHLL